MSPGGAGELLCPPLCCPPGAQVFKARHVYLVAPGPRGRSASARSSGSLRLQLCPQPSRGTTNPKYPRVCLTECGGAWQRSPSSGTRSPRRGETPAAASWLRRPPAARPGPFVLPVSRWQQPWLHGPRSQTRRWWLGLPLPCRRVRTCRVRTCARTSPCTKPTSRGAVQLAPSLSCCSWGACGQQRHALRAGCRRDFDLRSVAVRRIKHRSPGLCPP